MNEIDLGDRIVAAEGVCGGRARIRGTRIRVCDILAALGAGDTIDELVADFPYLSREDISAALNYAAQCMETPVVARAAD